jgi:ADP-ribosylglycohydrolase
MKLAPVALAYAHDAGLAAQRAAESARTTHGLPQAIDATRHLAVLLVEALNGAPRDELLRPRELADHHKEVVEVAAGSFLQREPPLIRGTGYAVAALEAALWAVRSTSSYADAVLAASNLGEDADTTAAIAGQLAGAVYGATSIPQAWRDRVFHHDEIVSFADALTTLELR